MSRIPSNKRVVEIGCGQGDVTAIFCQLGFSRVSSYEKDPLLAVNAKRRLMICLEEKILFLWENILRNAI